MKLLLDTHTALWLFNEHEKLPGKVKDCLLDEGNTLHISVVSAWEVAIKTSLGKLSGFNGGVRTFLSAIGQFPIDLLAVMPRHVELVESLPFLHRDPFDRLLVAAAITENMTLLTADPHIHKYAVAWMWQ
ncbi:MAG: type II toxin-antitoxin system VapC family toxin [Azoarcus sp.]|jgi:PIN domain nuclease of toxin-antitoxin system|nr:type II toxin-antitoxin system VapC family toxin [Azoarcus sp.]